MSGLWCSSWKTNHAYRHQRPSMAVKRIFLCVPRTKVAGGSECVKIMYPPPCWLDPRLIWKGEHPSPVLSEPLWHLTWPVFQSPRHDTVYEPVSFSVQIFFISIFVTIWIHGILGNFLVSFEFTSFDSLFSDCEIVYDSYPYVATGTIISQDSYFDLFLGVVSRALNVV